MARCYNKVSRRRGFVDGRRASGLSFLHRKSGIEPRDLYLACKLPL
jgi:hypothetical protein